MKYGELNYCQKCSSNNIKLVRFPISDGRIFYRYQCFQCGYVEIDNVKGTTIPEGLEIPMYDEELRSRYYERSQERWNRLDAEREERRKQFFEDLKDYYLSSEWREKRQQRLQWNKILNNGLCERCNRNEAAHVHHRDYKILNGLEHPLDLEVLCEKCHQMLHPHM